MILTYKTVAKGIAHTTEYEDITNESLQRLEEIAYNLPKLLLTGKVQKTINKLVDQGQLDEKKLEIFQNFLSNL